MLYKFKNISFITIKKTFTLIISFFIIIFFEIILINCSSLDYHTKNERKNFQVKTNFKRSCFTKKYFFLNYFKNNTSLKYSYNNLMNNLMFNKLYVPSVIPKYNSCFFTLSTHNIKNFSHKIFTYYMKKYCKYMSIKGLLNENFVKTAKNSGLDINEITNIMHIIKHQIRFHKLKYNNQFSILIKKNTCDKKIYKNKIVGLKIYYKGINYYGVMAENGKFYDKEGYSLMETFLKFPSLKKYRISSTFNPHRLNPITKKISPHQGIDLAMPIGTPILSTGSGEIIQTKCSIAAGRYIAIRHNVKYITRYMHLKKILVKVGEKVKKGEKIGLSGNTGYTTGPHLHYEIWLKNKVINPEKLIIPDRLSGNSLNKYLKSLKEIIWYLKNI